MGHREYFIASDKHSPEDIVRAWRGKVDFNSSDITKPVVLLFTKATVKKDFSMYGANFRKGEVGLTFEPDGISFEDLGYMMPDDMLNAVDLRNISFMENYSDCFDDEPLIVDGVHYSEGVRNSKGEPIVKRLPKEIVDDLNDDYQFE